MTHTPSAAVTVVCRYVLKKKCLQCAGPALFPYSKGHSNTCWEGIHVSIYFAHKSSSMIAAIIPAVWLSMQSGASPLHRDHVEPQHLYGTSAHDE